jgi:pentapeptide MXKDX repeat protein
MNLDLDFENMRRSDLSGVSDFFRLHTSRRRTNMKKLIAVFFTLSLLMCGVTVAQDTMKQDNMKADASAKAVKITGKISDDGKTFVNDKDSKSWTIQNPDAIKGHEGHHVTLSAHVYADKGEVHVMSLKMAK